VMLQGVLELIGVFFRHRRFWMFQNRPVSATCQPCALCPGLGHVSLWCHSLPSGPGKTESPHRFWPVKMGVKHGEMMRNGESRNIRNDETKTPAHTPTDRHRFWLFWMVDVVSCHFMSFRLQFCRVLTCQVSAIHDSDRHYRHSIDHLRSTQRDS
jgi:hypothetical protein